MVVSSDAQAVWEWMMVGKVKSLTAVICTLGLLAVPVTNGWAASCSIVGDNIDFGVSSDANALASVVANLALTCVDGPAKGGLSYLIRINYGQNGNGAERRLRNPLNGDTIRYQIYKDPGYLVVWGDTVASAAAGTVRFNGAGFSTSASGVTRIHARISPQDFANAAVGTYSDTLVTTIEF